MMFFSPCFRWNRCLSSQTYLLLQSGQFQTQLLFWNLQKFRSGGYNTIVATSIAEEGLDIMEVDLVICFDANISPLRMIQRMGRTGRKRDGRVDILLNCRIIFSNLLAVRVISFCCSLGTIFHLCLALSVWANIKHLVLTLTNGGTCSGEWRVRNARLPEETSKK